MAVVVPGLYKFISGVMIAAAGLFIVDASALSAQYPEYGILIALGILLAREFIKDYGTQEVPDEPIVNPDDSA